MIARWLLFLLHSLWTNMTLCSWWALMTQKKMCTTRLIRVHYTIWYVLCILTICIKLTWDSGNLVMDVCWAHYGGPWTAHNTQFQSQPGVVFLCACWNMCTLFWGVKAKTWQGTHGMLWWLVQHLHTKYPQDAYHSIQLDMVFEGHAAYLPISSWSFPLLDNLWNNIILPMFTDKEGNFHRSTLFDHDIIIWHVTDSPPLDLKHVVCTIRLG